MKLGKKLSIMSSILLTASLLSVGCSSTTTEEVDSSDVMANISARKAISMAINKEEFVDVILNDGSTVANYFVPKNLALDNEGNDFRDQVGDISLTSDDEKAKEEWEKAKEELGFEEVELELALSDTDVHKRLGEYVQSELGVLEGLTVTIKQLPFEQLMEAQTNGEYDISFGGWGPDYPDPLTYLSTLYPDQPYASRTGYNSEEYNELLDKGKNCTTTEESWKYYEEAEKLLLDDLYIHPLYQRGVSYLQKDYVSDITVATFGPKYSYKWTDVAKDDKVLNIYNTADITTLDNAKIEDALSREVTLNIMEGLIRLDKDLQPYPGMAETWETSEDGKTWTFNLRKDAKWSNGESVTAHDFEYGFKRTLTPETACPNASVFYDIVGAKDYNLAKNDDINSVGVKALDDYTLEIKLLNPVPYFDKLLAHPIFSPYNQKFVEEKGTEYGTSIENTLYNGPFLLDDWKMEDQYNMIKNENYWDKENVNLQKINVKVVKDANVGVNLYEANEIDRTALTADQVDIYEDSKELGAELDCMTYFFMYNVENRE